MAEMIASLGLSPRKVRQLELVPQAYLETKSEDGASSLTSTKPVMLSRGPVNPSKRSPTK